MTTWPNWVDLILVIILWRTCYSGYNRGLIAELLSLTGAICATAGTINYAGMVGQWLSQWLPFEALLTMVVSFWVLFLIVVMITRLITKYVASFIKWERLHWVLEVVGMLVGALRGFWWAGILLVAFSSSGIPFLRRSVEERSVLSPYLLNVSYENLEYATNHFPGAELKQPETLFPPLARVPAR